MLRSPDPSTVPVDDALLLTAYEHMRFARTLDVAVVNWQRQGLVPAFPPLRGQEAAQVGAALAFDRERDMLFPTYREHAVVVAAGLDLPAYFASHINQWHGTLLDPVASRFAPLQAVVAGSVLHAVGWAMGRRLDDQDGVAAAFLGDGASSQGDVHEAMNFAAVYGAPVVFFVQNNQWSLSTPLTRQVAGGSVSARAAGYGIPGLQVDGDDVAAVYRTTRAAVEHARTQHQPVVVEAMTYRRGPHATSDDPTRYRSDEDDARAGVDPIERAAAALRESGALTDEWEAAADRRFADRLADLHAYIAAARPMPGEEMFDHVFQEPTPQLLAQRAQWREESLWTEETADV